MMNIGKNTSVLFLVAGLITACSGDNSDLQRYLKKVKSRPGAAIQSIPKFSPLPIFRFPENDTRRSPFKPVEVKKTSQLAPDQKRVKQPLEAYPLDALNFVGILEEKNELWALIRDPDKKVVVIKVGSYMGQNFGRVMSITSNKITIEELIKKSGTWEKKTTTINLNTSK
jgi:type IV pilus assembly protein PilP